MKNLLSLSFLVAMVATLTSCATGLDPALLADALTSALEDPLAKIDGLSGSDRVLILDAVREGLEKKITALNEAKEFDWETPLWTLGGMVGAYFGVNIRRDMFRRQRGEPTGAKK